MRQADVKNAFCNGTLPSEEIVVVKPPIGCPVSNPNTLWCLKKTLYGLIRSPLHWYNNISQLFLSISLRNSPNSPCVFVGKILDNEPPLYLGLYVDDFCYFSESNKVEKEFKHKLDNNYSVSYDNKLEWFLGMKFEWKMTETDLQCLVHQEAFVLDMVD